MPEHTRRYPKRPKVFWMLFAVSTAMAAAEAVAIWWTSR